MQIKKIYSMQWGDPNHELVRLFADTNEGDNQEVGTPYGPDSIIWESVKAFPIENISPYVAPIDEVVV